MTSSTAQRAKKNKQMNSIEKSLDNVALISYWDQLIFQESPWSLTTNGNTRFGHHAKIVMIKKK